MSHLQERLEGISRRLRLLALKRQIGDYDMSMLVGDANYLDDGNAKLTEDDVRRILADPRDRRTLAREYGVHASNIGNIRNGRRWKHLSEVAAPTT